MLGVVLVAALVAAAAASPTIPVEAKAMYNPELFQGDIKGIAGQEPGHERAAILGSQYLWQLASVPYVLHSSITAGQKSIILKAMNEIESKTCIKFIERTIHVDHLEIVSNVDGCWSYLGRIGGRQRLSLNGQGCMVHGTVLHELMHAIGFFHEHTRNDRDNYITINKENVIEDASIKAQFDKDTNWQYAGEAYNYDSVMHYGSFSFSKNWGVLETITSKDPSVQITEPWQKSKLADSDANQINNLYSSSWWVCR